MSPMVLNTIATIMTLANLGFVAFAAAAPQGSLPWWVLAAFAAVNAVTHALPNQSVATAVKGMFK